METYSGDDFSLISPVFSQDANRHDLIDAQSGKKLEVSVIFTDTPGTLAALQMAEGLAQQLEAHFRLVMPYEVHYALPLTKPAVPVEFLEKQMRRLAGNTNLDVTAQICLCRDRKRALGRLLRPHSLVVVGGRKRWWPTAAQRLAQAVQADGHYVIFAEQR